MTEQKPTNIYQILSAISKDAGALVPVYSEGLKFAFRGIQEVTNHLAPHFDNYGVVIIPKVLSSDVEMHPVGNRFLTDAKVVVEYTFFAPDGTSVSAITSGYAQDYSDRASAQAQSVALRVAYIQVFHLPSNYPEPETLGAEVEKITAEEKAKPVKPVAGAAPVANAAVDSVDSIRADIAGLIAGTYVDPASGQVLDAYPGGGAAVNKLANELTKKKPDDWGKSAADLKKVREKLIADLKG